MQAIDPVTDRKSDDRQLLSYVPMQAMDSAYDRKSDEKTIVQSGSISQGTSYMISVFS